MLLLELDGAVTMHATALVGEEVKRFTSWGLSSPRALPSG